MITGAVPFTAPTPFELLYEHAHESLQPFPPGLGVPPEVFGLVFELTAKQKNDRYRSAEHFIRDHDQILNRI